MTGISKDPLRIIITGGGTGGHIYPALAITRGLQEAADDVKLLYIGSRHGLEENIVPAAGIPFETITVSGLERRLCWKNFRTVAGLSKGIARARKIIRSFNPDVVVGTGGYVCGPVVLSAAIMNVPTLIHEQNAYPGITNRILSRFVDRVCITFPEARDRFYKKADIIETGLPIRPDILKTPRGQAYEFFGLDSGKKTILIVGGSRGARTINQAARKVREWIMSTKNIQLIHITGRDNFEELMRDIESSGPSIHGENSVKILPYLDRMDLGLSIADLVVSRAGASFLAEITAVGVPAILIPYPFAAENHQEYNARSLEEKGAARVVLENSQFNADNLVKEIASVLQDEVLDSMALCSRTLGRPQALSSITGNVLQLAGR